MDALNNGLTKLTAFTSKNSLTTAVGALGAGVALGVGATALVGTIKRRKSKRTKSRNTRKRNSRIKHTSRGWKQDRKRYNKRQKWEVSYRKRKKMKSKKGIHYTKKGQPYKIMANGRARFIKKKGGKR